jgi:hypothetical protein
MGAGQPALRRVGLVALGLPKLRRALVLGHPLAL